MKRLRGIPVSPGIAAGKALIYQENEFPEIKRIPHSSQEADAEIKRFENALEEAQEELKLLVKKAAKEMGAEQAGIFTAHLMMLEDPDFIEQITDRIRTQSDNAEWAVLESSRSFIKMIKASSDPALRERASDIEDISKRVLSRLFSINTISLSDLEEDIILVSRDIAPSEILTMNRSRVKGIVLDMGSRTSHSAIMARAFNIPAVFGLSKAASSVKSGDTVIVDGSSAAVIVNPDNSTISLYKKTMELYLKKQTDDLSVKDLPAVTTDGKQISLFANIGIPEEAEESLFFGAEGIGVYRSEFLFLVPGVIPGEEVQFEAYKKVLKSMGKKPVIIRTVDLGGDKILPVQNGRKDSNPLLGWRGIRFSLAEPEIFKIQLRALLRAGVYGNLRIMFPLVSALEELMQALSVVEEVKEDLRSKKIKFSEKIETGIMIEVPSAAVSANILAEKAAFFSIGTNDLVQYTLAVDRGNELVNRLAQPLHPAVLSLIKNTADAAKKKGIKVSMCGEMAGDPFFAPLLIGIGIEEFSMTASSIPQVKKTIRKISAEDCRLLAEKLLSSVSAKESQTVLKNWTKEHFK